jgi:hypothetical protein
MKKTTLIFLLGVLSMCVATLSYYIGFCRLGIALAENVSIVARWISCVCLLLSCFLDKKEK